MANVRTIKKIISFQHYLQEQLKNPEFKKHYDAAGKKLEVAYKIIQLRKRSGISQQALAKKLGMTQSNISRIEAGEENLTTETLEKIAKTFHRDLKIEFV